MALLGPVQDARHELPGADAAGVVDDRVHGVEPFLCLGRIGVGRLEVNDASVSVVTLEFGSHGGALLSTTSSCRVQHGLEQPDHAGAVRMFGIWHGLDQVGTPWRVGRFGTAARGCSALASSTQGCHREGTEPVHGNRVAAPGAASVAALLDPAEGRVDVAERRPCRCPQRDAGSRPARGRSPGPARMRPAAAAAGHGRLAAPSAPSGDCQELGRVDVRERTRCARVPPATLVGGTRAPPSATA